MPVHSNTPLERYSLRTLNLIGMIVSGQDVRVVLSRRSQAPAVAVMESRTVVLHPERTGLYDLALCSRLLANRGRYRDLMDTDEHLPGEIIDRWIDAAHVSLKRDFPGITRLPGRFLPGKGNDGLEIAWKRVEWSPMEHGAGRNGLSLEGAPGLEITGANEDYGWLLESLQAGEIPLERYPGFEFPVARVPLHLSFSQAYGPKIEALEQQIAENKEMIEGLMQCYQRKSETLQELTPLGERRRSGVHLDSSRLVDAVLARHTGLEPKLFKKRQATFQPIFDPRQHLVVMGFDLNDLRRGPLSDPGFSQRFLGVLIRTYELLGVDFAILGFADHMLELPNGERVYLHAPIVLKDVDEDFDGMFWNRLAHVLEQPPTLPGEPACYHPLLMRAIGQTIEKESDGRRHSYRAVLMGGRRGMPGDDAFWTPEFLTQTANALDDEIEKVRDRYEGTLDTLGCFVPNELKTHARRGGAVSEMFT